MSDVSAGGAGTSQTTNSKATWSLVLGILSLTFCGLIAAILAIVLGKQAQSEIAESSGLQTGESRARWGIILGWISIGLSVVVAIIVAITYAG